MRASMRLRPIATEDLDLYRGLMTDPTVMSELGGPLPPEGLEDKLRGIVEDVERDRLWFLAVEDDGATAGWVCIWDHEDGVTEMGWMIAPAFQGRGLASAAVREILDRAREDGRWREIHAYPAVTNAPSNAICRRAGFELVDERDFVYQGRPLRCNDWRLTL